MIEFLPWSKYTYKEARSKYLDGHFSILDIQISGKCNYNCIYCDSPDRKKPCKIDFSHLEDLIRKDSDRFDWMFICGLGEPLWSENKYVLIRLLDLCDELGIKCSIFTNGSQADERIYNYVRKGILYPIVKIDTFSTELSNRIYNTTEAYKTLTAVDKLFDIARSFNDGTSHVAASIVPTTINLSEIVEIVQKCLENDVFPLIGQLEYAGKAVGNYERLLLSRDELEKLKAQIENAIGEKYNVPICPSVIAGLHITSDGSISVDKRSGLSCSWFWLETPRVIKLCDVNTLGSFSEADTSIIEYRQKVLSQMVELTKSIETYPFGGCGGNVKNLAEEYIKTQTIIAQK